MTDKTPNDRLRRLRELLDERWVEHVDTRLSTLWLEDEEGYLACVDEVDNTDEGLVHLHWWCTPEQAIEATLGQGTCHTVGMDCFGNPPYNQSGLHGNSTACGCSECGAPWSVVGLFRGNALSHNFKACPICGRRVVQE